MLITLTLLLLSLISVAPQIDSNIIEERFIKITTFVTECSFRESEFTPQLLYEALIFNGIQNPDIVLKQSIVETGNFTSNLFIATNNPFGMHLASSRQTITNEFVYGDYYDGQLHKMAKFNCWYDAVVDFKYWQTYWLNDVLTESQYYVFLDTLPYAANPNYVNIVKSITLNITIGS